MSFSFQLINRRRASVCPVRISALWPLISVIFLSGCGDEQDSAPVTKQVQVLPEDLFKTAPPPRPEQPAASPPPQEDLDLDRFEFPDQSPLNREQQARILRGQRQWQSWQQQTQGKQPNSGPVFSYLGQDPDYQQGEPMVPADRSSLPVDRSRILTADMRISAVLEDSVYSQVPGRVMAVVDRDVLSPNNRTILLPAYTRIICNYGSLNKIGQSRLPISCKRAIRPDGVSIMLTEAKAADQMGRSGLVGEVDQHLWQKYGAAFTMAAISSISQMAGNSSHREGINHAGDALSQGLGQVTARVLDQYLEMAPTITIAAGSRIQIIPEQDIYLRPPVAMISVTGPDGRQIMVPADNPVGPPLGIALPTGQQSLPPSYPLAANPGQYPHPYPTEAYPNSIGGSHGKR